MVNTKHHKAKFALSKPIHFYFQTIKEMLVFSRTKLIESLI